MRSAFSRRGVRGLVVFALLSLAGCGGDSPGNPDNPGALPFEHFDAGFFALDKPRGWDLVTAGSCTEFAFLVQDPAEPRRQIFYFGSVGPVYLNAQQKALDRNHPGARLREHAQRLDELEGRLAFAMQTRLERARRRHAAAEALLARASPALRVAALGIRLDSARRALAAAGRACLGGPRARLDVALRTLHAVSPLATLERGYAIVTDADGHVLQQAARVPVGTTIRARLAHGHLTARVTDVAPDGDESA